MAKPDQGSREKRESEDILAKYRERILLRFGLVVVILVLPISIVNFIEGQTYLGMAIMSMLAVLAINSFTIYLGRSPAVSFGIFVFTLAVVIGISLFERGVFGVLWIYPAIIFVSFAVSHRTAKIYSAALFVYFSVLVFYLIAFQLAVRAVIALVLTIAFTTLFLNIIYKLRERLVERSVSDPLTGALNRRELDSRLGEAIERKRRTQTPASLLMLDIDHFKSINDNYGHAAGDDVLIEFVKMIKNRARIMDQLFRTGGEEFLLFLPDTPESGAMTLAEDIRKVVSEAQFIKNRRVTVSIGLSELRADEAIEEWVKQGDIALYQAKEDGRNRVCSRREIKMITDVRMGASLNSVRNKGQSRKT